MLLPRVPESGLKRRPTHGLNFSCVLHVADPYHARLAAGCVVPTNPPSLAFPAPPRSDHPPTRQSRPTCTGLWYDSAQSGSRNDRKIRQSGKAEVRWGRRSPVALATPQGLGGHTLRPSSILVAHLASGRPLLSAAGNRANDAFPTTLTFSVLLRNNPAPHHEARPQR